MTAKSQYTIHEAHQLLKSKQISSQELTRIYIERTQNLEPRVRALVTQTADEALEQAKKADQMIASGQCGPLTGVPAIIKDNMCSRGIKTTCSSKMLANFVPPYNATVIEKLEQAGVVMIGKANMDEFAMGSSTENSAFFTTCNPWDTSRVPGGSSGGSAASVAAGEAVYALGSDTGGSIPSTGRILQRNRTQTHLWKGQPLWAGGFRQFTGPDRTLDTGCRRLRPGYELHLRLRPAGLYFSAAGSAGLYPLSEP